MPSMRGRLWRIRPNTRCPLLAEPHADARPLEQLVTGATGRAREERGGYVRVVTQGGVEGYVARQYLDWV
jgi:hypothetical protein